jgi:hypothetical protein
MKQLIIVLLLAASITSCKKESSIANSKYILTVSDSMYTIARGKVKTYKIEEYKLKFKDEFLQQLNKAVLLNEDIFIKKNSLYDEASNLNGIFRTVYYTYSINNANQYTILLPYGAYEIKPFVDTDQGKVGYQFFNGNSTR